MKKMLFFLTLLHCGLAFSLVDFIAYSKDRPLQLFALLESVEKYYAGLGRKVVIYTVADSIFEQGYEIVKQRFPDYFFINERETVKNFKEITMSVLNDCANEHVMFSPDDIIATDFADLEICAATLKEVNGWGFFLGWAPHLTDCYTLNCKQKVPNFKQVDGQIFAWQFKDGSHGWSYPNTVDMVIYPKSRVIKSLSLFSFNGPNELEGRWNSPRFYDLNAHALCFATTRMINIPLNRVQDVSQNKNMEFATPEEFLRIFLDGKKIDISVLFKLKNNSEKYVFEPTYIDR